MDSGRGWTCCWYTRTRQEHHLQKRYSNSNLLKWWKKFHIEKNPVSIIIIWVNVLFGLHVNKCIKVFGIVVIFWVSHYFLFGSSSRYRAVNHIHPQQYFLPGVVSLLVFIIIIWINILFNHKSKQFKIRNKVVFSNKTSTFESPSFMNFVLTTLTMADSMTKLNINMLSFCHLFFSHSLCHFCLVFIFYFFHYLH